MPQLLIHSETGEASYLSIDSDTITIGRRRNNSLCLPHLSVSGEHARISNENGCLVIEDLNSTNGTRINGEYISKRQVLVHLDDITIGSYRISYSETHNPLIQDTEASGINEISTILPMIDPSYESKTDGVAIIRVSSGNKAGSVVMLEKAVTTVGKADGDLGAIAKKDTGYYFLPVNDQGAPMTHNGKGLMPQVEVKLVGGDMISVGGELLEFVYPYYS